jgi:hypothetical protein
MVVAFASVVIPKAAADDAGIAGLVVVQMRCYCSMRFQVYYCSPFSRDSKAAEGSGHWTPCCRDGRIDVLYVAALIRFNPPAARSRSAMVGLPQTVSVVARKWKAPPIG